MDRAVRLARKARGRFAGRLHDRVYGSRWVHDRVTRLFHIVYYHDHFGPMAPGFEKAAWLGVPTQKCPFDLWVYQELIARLRPDLIIETGTARGGSALFMASICDLVGNGRVVTVDIADVAGRPQHPRLSYVLGSSTAPETARRVGEFLPGAERVMVILDSDHRRDHVLGELRAYGPLVTPRSYLIVEDTNINGHPVLRRFGPGPMEAVEKFLRDNRDFVVDRTLEKFSLTMNPRGFLRRVR